MAPMPTAKRNDSWTMDEYVVVADLYLTRRKSSGTRDPDVQRIAALTGRTAASISRRMGNYHGTALGGAGGLKPVTGAALAMFRAMETNEQFRLEAVADAMSRLTGVTTEHGFAPGQIRYVPVEEQNVETFDVEPNADAREAIRREATLVRHFCDWAESNGRTLSGARIPVAGGFDLSVDLIDRERNLLIEAKSSSSRTHLRHAVGQLFDYARYFEPRPALAILVPERPSDDLLGLPLAHGIDVIWPTETGYVSIAMSDV